jgi:hypothetical protein
MRVCICVCVCVCVPKPDAKETKKGGAPAAPAAEQVDREYVY